MQEGYIGFGGKDRDTFVRYAETYFSELYGLVDSADMSLRHRYEEMYRLFNVVLNEQTAGSPISFSGPFPKMDYLCKKMTYDDEAYFRLNSFRAFCMHLSVKKDDELESFFLSDVRTLSEFIRDLYDVSIPDNLFAFFPRIFKYRQRNRNSLSYIRIIVDNWDDEYIYGRTSGEDSEKVKIKYHTSVNGADFTYIKEILTENTQLNVIGCIEEEDYFLPEQIIYEPDYLVDISSIAACFESYGTTHLVHLINRIKPQEIKKAILLGNFSGQLLDEAIYKYSSSLNNKERYSESAMAFFRNNALALATCDDMDRAFHQDALMQQNNLIHMVSEIFPGIENYDPEKIILEPSFFCEKLGIQGRMDLLQEDMKVLMEQKSGKKDFHTDGHVEKHYVQMLLYLALLHYNFGKNNTSVSCYLLYSRYHNGLIKEGNAPMLLAEALRIRNMIVWSEYNYSNGNLRELLDNLTPEDFHLINSEKNRVLWDRYSKPQLKNLLSPLQCADDLEKDYFYRFFRFIQREHILSKIGTSSKEASGFSSIWNTNLAEKKQVGNIFDKLHIVSYGNPDGGSDSGISQITLSVPRGEEDVLPNFRVGDIVILYPYLEEEEPDARKTMVFRCNIKELRTEEIVLSLRSPQKNKSVFVKPGHFWAVEHDFMDSSYSALYRSMYSFLTAKADRKDMILNRRQPQIDRTLSLNGDYSHGGKCPDFNELVLKAKQAKDFFLLIGPPGTGKTSLGLVNILKETLSNPQSSVLLVSFTNRAVDEICSKLKREEIDFIRFGSSLSCDDAYYPYLLGNKVSSCSNITEIRNTISETRVFVGTTTAVTSNLNFFSLKKFDLAIIDEASQILEPHLMGLLCAKHGNSNAIDKFVFIGDHKQLPAVVSQSESESAVSEESLKNIGLVNCRYSLFERLLSLHKGNDSLFFTLTKQGRMHPGVSAFPNKSFYADSLVPVPLSHQIPENLPFAGLPVSGLERLLASRRFLFISSPRIDNPYAVKVNIKEAEIISLIVKSVWDLYLKSGKSFSAASTLGIIVPYRNQISAIRKEISKYNIPELSDITIDTVERYQGSERDVIIYGFTVQKIYQLDFLAGNVFVEDGVLIDRKLNVALTRAREQMIIVGEKKLLSHNSVFAELIEYSEKLGCFFDWKDMPE